MIKVSIIVPFINGEDYLKECIENLQKQQYPDYEIILIDDGSKDNSKGIINNYLQNSKIKYYYLNDKTIGVGKARNFGIEKARGEYIMFVDVDDCIDENLLKYMEKYMNKNIDIIKYKLEIVNFTDASKKDIGKNGIDTSKTNQNKVKRNEFEGKTIRGEEGFNKLCFEDKYLDSPCLYLIKKDMLKEKNLKFRENMYHEDFGLIPRLIVKAKSMVLTDYCGYYYVQTNESIMRNNNYEKELKKVEDKIEHYKNMVDFLEVFMLSKETKQNMKIYYTNSIILSLKNLNKIDRRKIEKRIKNLKMIENFKICNIKSFIKRIMLSINIEMYLTLSILLDQV